MNIHIAMMGKVTEPVTKSFQALGYDKLYLLASSRYQESIDAVTAALGAFDVPVEVRYISGFDFQEIVDAIYRIYETENGKSISFSINITGGTNLMAAAACTCAFFIGATIYYVMMGDGPVKDQVIPIPTPKTPNMAAIKQDTREFLRFILEESTKGNPVTTDSLMSRFNRSKQSINQKLNILRNEGLVENGSGIGPDGRPDRRYRTIVLTRQGRLIASWVRLLFIRTIISQCKADYEVLRTLTIRS